MTTETSTRPTFLGIEIQGDISKTNRTEQWPMDQLAPIVQAILDDPTIAEFGWRQYTPYFNDGDACEFGAHGAWVRLVSDPPAGEDDYEELDIDYGSSARLGERGYEWVGEHPNRSRVDKAYVGPDEARYDRLRVLSSAIEGGHFDDVLLDAFGDHARVLVRRDGIQVDTYEHD